MGKPTLRPLFLLPLLLVGLAGCRQEAPPAAGFSLEDAVRQRDYGIGVTDVRGVQFFDEPRIEDVTVDHQRRSAVILPAGRWAWRGPVPAGGRLVLGAAALGEEKAVSGSFAVSVDAGQGPQIVGEVRRPRAGKRWADLVVDLTPWAGEEVTVELYATLATEEPPEVAWAPVVLRPSHSVRREVRPTSDPPRPPNIVLILVDTLRHDHLGSYGYDRPTSPRIDALLAERGVLFEDAYAQAPWTLPSVVSMMTGRYPTELLPERQAAYRIPDDVPSISEMLGDLGYETAAFYANPALHAETGFGRGFDTFFAPPASFDWFERHADDLQARLLPWVEARGEEPFFLYAHYLDPHDPYDNPEVVEDKSPFLPGYDGPLDGHSVHRIYGGFDPLPDPSRDVPQLTALYDSEIAYVDRFVGDLLDALGPEVLADTLVIFTSDHGEELYDHGGWKHGQSLYEEQIHVPLLLRWDGELPAGRRVEGTVELLDVVPTALAAAGGEPDPRWQGTNLLPVARGEARPRRRSAFFQHLAAGPLRAGTVLDRHKLIFFNRREPFEPPDAFQAYLWKKDLRRFEDVELYDLAADPEETTNLAGEAPELVRHLADIIHRRLDRRFPGLRLMLDELPAGSRLSGKLVFAGEPEGWDVYFLGPEDEIRLDGRELTFALSGGDGSGAGPVPGRGILIDAPELPLEVLDLRLDGAPLAPAALRLGDGVPWTGGAIGREALLARRWPPPSEGTGLRLWLPAQDIHLEAGEEDEETVRRLKALGYLLQ